MIEIARLAEVRKAAGLSQVEAARRLGVTQGALSQWESGTSLPRADKLPEIARLYGCTVDELFGEV